MPFQEAAVPGGLCPWECLTWWKLQQDKDWHHFQCTSVGDILVVIWSIWRFQTISSSVCSARGTTKSAHIQGRAPWMLFVLCDAVFVNLDKRCARLIGFVPSLPKEPMCSPAVYFAFSLLYPAAADERSAHCWLKECGRTCLNAKCIDSQCKNKMHNKKALKLCFSLHIRIMYRGKDSDEWLEKGINGKHKQVILKLFRKEYREVSHHECVLVFHLSVNRCPKTNEDIKSMVTLKGMEDKWLTCSPFTVKYSNPLF